MYTQSLYKPLPLALAALWVQAAVAQDNSIPTLEPVVITASRMPQLQSDAVANTTVLNRTDIDRSSAVDLPGLIATLPGVQITRSGSSGQVASVFLRGTSSAHTLILIDGVPVNDNSFGTARLELISLDMIERIEIVRGNVSAQYGSQAIGGVIQLFTKQGKQGLEGAVTTEIGTQGHKKLNLAFSAGNQTTQLSLGLSRVLVDGVTAQLPSQGTTNPDKDGFAQTAAHMKVTHALSKDVTVNFGVLSNQGKTDYDSDSPTASLVTQQTLAMQQVGIHWRVNPNWKLSADYSEQKTTGHDEENALATSDVLNKRRLLNVQNELTLANLGMLLVGLDVRSDFFDGQSYGPYASHTANQKRNTSAVYTGFNGKTGGFTWNTALRYDAGQGAGSDSELTYLLGANLPISHGFSINTSYSTAFNRPTLSQIHDPTYGNLLLRSELARNAELGLQWQSGTQLVRATLFTAKTKDLLGFDPSTYQSINVNRASNKGLELLGELNMPWAGGKLRLGATAHNPVDDVTGKTLQRRNKTQANIGVSGNFSAWGWNVSAQYQGDRMDVDYSGWPYVDVTLKNYIKLDASIRYKVSAHAAVSLSLANITQARDQSAYGYASTPRGALLKFNYKI